MKIGIFEPMYAVYVLHDLCVLQCRLVTGLFMSHSHQVAFKFTTAVTHEEVEEVVKKLPTAISVAVVAETRRGFVLCTDEEAMRNAIGNLQNIFLDNKEQTPAQPRPKPAAKRNNRSSRGKAIDGGFIYADDARKAQPQPPQVPQQPQPVLLGSVQRYSHPPSQYAQSQHLVPLSLFPHQNAPPVLAYGKPRGERVMNCYAISIQNVPESTTNKQLYELLSACGDILSIQRVDTMAMLYFPAKESVAAAIVTLNGKEVNGAVVTVAASGVVKVFVPNRLMPPPPPPSNIVH